MEGCLPRCPEVYYGLFYHLEDMGILDPNNDIHLFCLYYVYLPRINRHLSTWKNAWNMHPLRTESNNTPLQIWMRGLLACFNQHDLRERDDELLDEVLSELCMYHI